MRNWFRVTVYALLATSCASVARPRPSPPTAAPAGTAREPQELHILREPIEGDLSTCVDITRAGARGEVVIWPDFDEPPALPWDMSLPEAGAGPGEVVSVRRISSPAGEQVWVLYLIGSLQAHDEQYNVAAYLESTRELLWASTASVQPRRGQTCVGNFRVVDVNCDSFEDVLLLRSCYDAVCPRNDSPDAECHGPYTAHDLVHVWDPTGRRYVTYRPTAQRDAEGDCASGLAPFDVCGPDPDLDDDRDPDD